MKTHSRHLKKNKAHASASRAEIDAAVAARSPHRSSGHRFRKFTVERVRILGIPFGWRVVER